MKAAPVDKKDNNKAHSDCRALVPVHANHHRSWSPRPYRNVSPRCSDVTCRDLVPHPTKYNRDLYKGNSTPRRCTTIEALPTETMKQIFHFLDANSLCSSEQVCSFWRDASKDDTYWVDLCRTHFGLCPSSLVPPPDPVKLLYMMTIGSLAGIKYGTQRAIRVF